MRSGARVRPLARTDLDPVVDLCLRARAELGVGRQLCTDDRDRLREQIGALLGLDGATVLVATLDDEPAGVLLGRLVGPGPFTEAVVLNLEALYVRPDARRRGIGHALLVAAADAAGRAGADEVFASPLPGARGMHRFLARLGFAPAAAHRVVPTAVLQRRLAHDTGSAAVRRPASRGIEDLLERRRRARARAAEAAQPVASTSMQVSRAVHSRRPSASSTTTW